MPYMPIVGTLGFIFSEDRRAVLMVHRIARSDDSQFGRYNGLGGKLEPLEDVVSGMKREILEEANLVVEELHLAGTVSWPGFGPKGEDWLGFIFRILKWSGTPPESNAEGALSWIPIEKVLELPLWEGDRYFLPMVFDLSAAPFHGVMPYSGGRPTGWKVSILPN
ncbi:MAG: NUDIX hydrolase [Gemmataceae bacterium]